MLSGLFDVPEGGSPIGTPAVPPTALGDHALGALRKAVGDDNVLIDDAARAAHANGQSYLDFVARGTDAAVPVPDAVVTPADEDAIAALFGVAGANDIAVVPFGGGTSVVGGVNAVRGSH